MLTMKMLLLIRILTSSSVNTMDLWANKMDWSANKMDLWANKMDLSANKMVTSANMGMKRWVFAHNEGNTSENHLVS